MMQFFCVYILLLGEHVKKYDYLNKKTSISAVYAQWD